MEEDGAKLQPTGEIIGFNYYSPNLAFTCLVCAFTGIVKKILAFEVLFDI